MRAVVLRLGHRPERDKRITTHVGLVARAFGAEEMLLCGRDAHVEESLNDAARRWGGAFRLTPNASWKGEIVRWKESGGQVVHLTMYGSNLPDVIDEIRKSEDILIVVGAEKVPAEVYQLADWNVAVGNQPHSDHTHQLLDQVRGFLLAQLQTTEDHDAKTVSVDYLRD